MKREGLQDMPSVDLPPPNWSPTGNSGSWVWDENYTQRIGKKKISRGCYRWYDDIYGYEWKKGLDDARRKKGGLLKPREKNWLERLKNFLT